MVPAIFVSPHLDDAVLSCGGGIARLTHAGTTVPVVTVFTADQPLGEPLSPLARRAHTSWGVGDQPFAVRRAEDLSALRLLGAEAVHLGLLEAMYRRSRSGTARYQDSLASPTPCDVEYFLPQLAAALRDSPVAATPGARVFCPTGTGGHVDHVLVRRAIEQIVDAEAIVYYEEYPYVTRRGVSSAMTGTAETQPPDALSLSAEELEGRIAAIGCYASQLRGLFPSGPERLNEIASARLPVIGRWLVRPPNAEASLERMAAQVRKDTSSLGGERYRWPSGSGSPFPRT